MTMLLEARNIHAGYGSVAVLRDLSFHLSTDESVGLFGPNGHGKTTLLMTISGLVRPTSGSIHYDGKDITRDRASDIVAAGLAHSPQGNTLFGEMGVAEILELAAFTPRARRSRKQQLERVYALFPRLAERQKQLARTLSGGERQMLSIGCALMCDPRLLMLDEPTLGLSPKLKEELAIAVAEIAKAGTPLVVVEQDVQFLLSLTDRLYMIEHGEVVREIDRADAPDHAEIMQLYFGGTDD